MKKRKNLLIHLFFIVFSVQALGQEVIPHLNACRFKIVQDTDTIEFIKFNTDLESCRPTLLFCQGSQPLPLIVDRKDGKRTAWIFEVFDYEKIAERFNLIMISSPHTPLITNEENLNTQGAYILDKKNNFSFSPDFLKANYMERYVERGSAVIRYLCEQKWVDQKRLYVIGHSQGAKVGTKIAAENEEAIAAFGFLSGNPLGRIDNPVREARLAQHKGLLTEEEAQKKINETYEWWKWVNENVDNPDPGHPEPTRNAVSFNIPVLPELLSLKIPVYVAYGTYDIGSLYCDLLPIDFIRVGKKNYKVVPYPGLEHNFFEVDAQGKPDYKGEAHWTEVMNNLIGWFEEINNPPSELKK